jgi:O-antigen/teichoic acid export membrane protein
MSKHVATESIEDSRRMTTQFNFPKPLPRISVQAFWLAAAKFISALFNLALPILLVRLLSQSEYGVYKQAFLFIGTVTNIAALGVGMSAYYFIPRHPEKGGEISLNIFIYNLFVGLVPLLLLASYPGLLTRLFRTHELAPLALLLGILVVITLDGSLIQVIPTAMQEVRDSTLLIIGSQFVRAIMFIATAVIFRTIESLIVVSIFHQLLTTFVLLWYLKKKFGSFWTRFDWTFFREQLAYAIPYGGLGLLWVVQKDLDNYFVGAKLGPAEFAIYSVGWLEIPLISLFLESIASVLIIRVSALQHQDRKEDIRNLISAATTRLASFQFPIYAFLLVAGHDLIVLMYTNRYERSAPIFAIAITLLPLSVFLMDPIVRSYKELRTFALIIKIVIFAALFCLLSPVINRFGVMGAVMMAVGAQVFERFVMGWKTALTVEATTKDVKLYIDFFKVAAIAVVSASCAYFVRSVWNPAHLVSRILLVASCLSAVYLPLFYFLRLPGWDTFTVERVKIVFQTGLARLRRADV